MSITLGIKITIEADTLEEAESILDGVGYVEDIYYDTED